MRAERAAEAEAVTMRQSRRLKAHASARLRRAGITMLWPPLDWDCFTDEGDDARPLGLLSESRFYVSNPPPEAGYEVAATLTPATGREG